MYKSYIMFCQDVPQLQRPEKVQRGGWCPIGPPRAFPAALRGPRRAVQPLPNANLDCTWLAKLGSARNLDSTWPSKLASKCNLGRFWVPQGGDFCDFSKLFAFVMQFVARAGDLNKTSYFTSPNACQRFRQCLANPFKSVQKLRFCFPHLCTGFLGPTSNLLGAT